MENSTKSKSFIKRIEPMRFSDFIEIYDLKDGDKINVDYWHLTKTGNGANCDIRGPSEAYFTIKKDAENYDFATSVTSGNERKEFTLSQKECVFAYHKNLKSLIIVRLLENDDKPSTEVHILSNIVKVNK